VDSGPVVAAYSSGAAVDFHHLPFYPEAGPKTVSLVLQYAVIETRSIKKSRLWGGIFPQGTRLAQLAIEK
jgi:hypothetical protein